MRLFLVISFAAVASLLNSSNLWAGIIGMNVTKSSRDFYTPGGYFTETMGYYIRPNVDMTVTSLGYYNGWRAIDDYKGGGTIFATLNLIDDHPLGIFEIDSGNYHDEYTPGNGQLIAETVLRVGEGTYNNYFQYKDIAPTVLRANHIYAMVGYGSDRDVSYFQNNTLLDDGDPVGYYGVWDDPDWTGGDYGGSYGPDFEFIGGAWSYLPGLSQPFWRDPSQNGWAYGADPTSLYLGPGFQYELNNTAAVPEPASWIALLVGGVGLAAKHRFRRKALVKPSGSVRPTV